MSQSRFKVDDNFEIAKLTFQSDVVYMDERDYFAPGFDMLPDSLDDGTSRISQLQKAFGLRAVADSQILEGKHR